VVAVPTNFVVPIILFLLILDTKSILLETALSHYSPPRRALSDQGASRRIFSSSLVDVLASLYNESSDEYVDIPTT